ncbi:Tetratricopeptide TPR_2 repeat protein [Magnetococcus marinus MC-1]|uniref:Tetratricopeptide TPR_2 repeat protein n=1 Tax=Magnetococcus marinus (strain ATCC BAA-1437 / JCM 17883 / MC-1) TaxID=156889 RepID=A0L5I9_MAGMM|nr:tetratricopeptide repeat protein [Magnetococcus marinus]ABK43232.1 Tetratricopeptide TPR_2 repeat protein [Magnetococcus marinus MC-1]
MNKQLSSLLQLDAQQLQQALQQAIAQDPDPQQAAQDVTAWLCRDAQDAQKQYLLGWQKFHQGDFNGALYLVEQSMAWGAVYPDILRLKVLVYIALGQGKKALEQCQLLSKYPLPAGMLNLLTAYGYLVLNQLDSTEDAARQALLQAPRWSPPYVLMLQLSEKLQKPLLTQYIQAMLRHFLPHVGTVPATEPADTLFFDQQQARQVAAQALLVNTPYGGRARQLCVVLGGEGEEPGLLGVKESELLSRWSESALRMPSRIEPDWDNPAQIEQGFWVVRQLFAAQHLRDKREQEITQRMLAVAPRCAPDEPPRLLLICARQHPSYAGVVGLVQMLEAQAQVVLCDEASDYAQLDVCHILEQINQWQPHVVVWWEGPVLALPSRLIIPMEKQQSWIAAQRTQQPEQVVLLPAQALQPQGGEGYQGLHPEQTEVLQRFAQWLLSQVPSGEQEAAVATHGVMQAEHQQQLAVSYQTLLAGQVEQAVGELEALLRLYPQQGEIQAILANLALAQKKPEEARNRLLQAVAANPRHELCLELLAQAYVQMGQITEAEAVLKRLLAFAPDHQAGLLALANLYLDHVKPVPEVCLAHLNHLLRLNRQEPSIYAALVCYWAMTEDDVQKNWAMQMMNHFVHDPSKRVHVATEDLFCVTPELALAQAHKGLLVKHTAAIALPQICYYQGEALDDHGLENLIAIQEKVSHYFSVPLIRRPTQVLFDPANPEQVATAKQYAELFDLINKARQKRANAILERYRQTPPGPMLNGRVRVLATASRMTTVMRYSSAGLIQAFKKIGCDVRFLMGRNNREDADALDIMTAHHDFDPHLVVSINWAVSGYYHPERWNAVWYQDPMPDINKGKKQPWRERDLVYSVLPYLDEMIIKSGYKNPRRQSFCVDLDLYKRHKSVEKRHKIIFVGSAYARHLTPTSDAERGLVEQFVQASEAGEALSPAQINQMAEQVHLSPLFIREYVYPFAVRDLSVRWLCELAPELPYAVEVYGYGWENDPVVAPYYKGVAQQGMHLVQIYNEAKYALSPQAHLVNSQRTVEIAACGAIPVLNDHRQFADLPHWDEHMLFYKTKADMRQLFSQSPLHDPYEMALSYSYESFAQRILEDAGLASVR